MGSLPLSDDRSEIVFFDVETTVPTRPGQGFALLEFGAILVCPRKLTELRNYSTLVRPSDLSLISPQSEQCNGINAKAVSNAPKFADIAHAVYDLLHGLFNHFIYVLLFCLENGRVFYVRGLW
jgi:DNA polymerase III epsilon subunit-like protein